jgi:hypothetical protein
MPIVESDDRLSAIAVSDFPVLEGMIQNRPAAASAFNLLLRYCLGST